MKDLVISYLLMRRLIGILGVALPFILLIGTSLLSNAHWLQPSISHYYYSVMHMAFVGVLCLLSGFLISYRGKQAQENRLSNWAGVFALGVATFPTGHDGFIGVQYVLVPFWKSWFNWIHYGSAGLLFGCFAIFCFRIFQQSDHGTDATHFDAKKKRRNSFYTFCGVVIAVSIGCIGALAIYSAIAGSEPAFARYTTFIFETTSLLAFGSSWLLKGTYELPKLKGPAQKVVSYFR